jgi:hypothetical protein
MPGIKAGMSLNGAYSCFVIVNSPSNVIRPASINIISSLLGRGVPGVSMSFNGRKTSGMRR